MRHPHSCSRSNSRHFILKLSAVHRGPPESASPTIFRLHHLNRKATLPCPNEWTGCVVFSEWMLTMNSLPFRLFLIFAATCLFSSIFACEETVSPELTGSEMNLLDGSPDAVGILGLLNDATSTVEVLDIQVGLNRRAAENLVIHRNGADGNYGSADDNPFDDVTEVDNVPQVGPAAMETLLAYARMQGWVPEGDDPLGAWDGVSFTVIQAEAVLEVANNASEPELDFDIGLDNRAATAIVQGRPIVTVLQLSELAYVGESALEKLKQYASPAAVFPEIGIISDLDKTIIPPHRGELPETPYPGVATLLTELEFCDNGQSGDMYFVTARSPDRIEGIPEWLEQHGVPSGPIATGVTGVPWLAQGEKVSDISAILEANPDQSFVLLGDSNHRDPEVFQEVIALHPDRIAAACVHRVNNVNESRVEGLCVYENYAELAAYLLGLGLLDELGARAVMTTAQSEGVDISDERIDELISQNRQP